MYQLFTAGGPDPSGAELAKMRETATFYLGTENMHQGDFLCSYIYNYILIHVHIMQDRNRFHVLFVKIRWFWLFEII